VLAQPSPSVRENVVVDAVFVVFVRLGPGTDICGGKIANNKARFCTLPCEAESDTCRFASHATKAEIPFPAYFIRASKGSTAFCVPCLIEPEQGFSLAIRQSLAGKRSSAEWARIFPTLNSATTLSDGQQLDLIARGERTVTVGPTPMKSRILDSDSAREMGIDNSFDESSEHLSISSEQMFADAALPDGLEAEVSASHMALYWNEMIAISMNRSARLKEFETMVRATVEEVDDKVVQVAATVGTRPGESNLPLTLWAAVSSFTEELESIVSKTSEFTTFSGEKIEFIASELFSFHKVVDENIKPVLGILSSAVKELRDGGVTIPAENRMAGSSIATSKLSQDLQARHELLVKEMQGLKDDMDKVVRSQSRQLNVGREFDELQEAIRLKFSQYDRRPPDRNLEKEISDLKSMQRSLADQLNRGLAGRTSAAPSAPGEDMGTLKQDVEDLRAQMYSLRYPVATNTPPPGVISEDTQVQVEELSKEVATLRDQVKYLELDNKLMRSELVTDTVVFGGHFFLSEDSYTQFVATHFSTQGSGFFLDFISMLECAADRNRTTQESLKNMKVMHDAKFEDPNEAIIYASFSTIIPQMLGVEHDPKDHSKKMGSMTDMKEWDPNTVRAGRKTSIHTALTNLKRSTDLQITTVFGHSSVPSLFLKNLAFSTFSFWESFASWISRFENEMVSQMNAESSPAQKASIWNLICWLIHSMLTEMATRRAPGGVARTLSRTDSIGINAALLQGTLGAHKFMAELTEKQFNKHPLFAATMAEFLMTTKASVIVLEEVRATAKTALTTVRALQSERDKKGALKRGEAKADTP
jgi:hypothetical protein